MLDQFLQDSTNKRTDAYGGSVENKARFPLEVIDAVTKAVGAKRTAVRMSPWSAWNGEASCARLSNFPTYLHDALQMLMWRTTPAKFPPSRTTYRNWRRSTPTLPTSLSWSPVFLQAKTRTLRRER